MPIQMSQIKNKNDQKNIEKTKPSDSLLTKNKPPPIHSSKSQVPASKPLTVNKNDNNNGSLKVIKSENEYPVSKITLTLDDQETSNQKMKIELINPDLGTLGELEVLDLSKEFPSKETKEFPTSEFIMKSDFNTPQIKITAPEEDNQSNKRMTLTTQSPLRKRGSSSSKNRNFLYRFDTQINRSNSKVKNQNEFPKETSSEDSKNSSTPRGSIDSPVTSIKMVKKNSMARRQSYMPEQNKKFGYNKTNVLKLFKIESQTSKNINKKDLSINLHLNQK